MKTQTAVEWLAEQMTTVKWKMSDETDRNSIIEQAKAMERGQMITSWHNGYDNQSPMIDEENCGEQYYNETFNK